MCDLTAIFAIGSSLMGAWGQYEQGRAANQAAQYQAQIARMNAEMADRRAQDAIERGREEEQKQMRATSQLMGKQQVGMAANGVDLSFGSPLDLIVDTALMGELDALTIKKNAYREAQDYKQQAANFRAEGEMQRLAGKNAKRQGILQAGGTLLGGFGNAYSGAMKSGGLKIG